MQPILKDFPDHLETERLLLHAPRAGDGHTVYEATLETLENLRRWPYSMPWAQFEPSVEASEAFCRTAQAAFLARTDMSMLIFSKADSTFVGLTALHPTNWAIPKFEIGYWCRKSCEGQGYITEAVRGLAAFARKELGARRLEIRQNASNLRSRNVAERAGFALEGILRNDRIAADGAPDDTSIYGMSACT